MSDSRSDVLGNRNGELNFSRGYPKIWKNIYRQTLKAESISYGIVKCQRNLIPTLDIFRVISFGEHSGDRFILLKGVPRFSFNFIRS